MLGLGLAVCLPRTKHISDHEQLISVIGKSWPGHTIPIAAAFKSISSVSCVTIISIWLKWYAHLDITSNTLRFSENPIEAYTEPVKVPDDQHQSRLIVASTSDVSLRLKTIYTYPDSDSHRHIVILPMGFRGVYPERSCSRSNGKQNLLSHSHKYPILK